MYDQVDPRMAHKGTLEDAGRAEDHIIAESTAKELKRGGA